MNKRKSESGQSLILISIMFLFLLAIAALVIDGGSLYLNRRNAQTAADAAAMAGAREKCVAKGSTAQINDVIVNYAVTQNGATSVEWEIDEDGYLVVRTALVTPSFFATVLGRDVNPVQAEAAAGCFAPRTVKNLLPIAWTCRPPVGGSTGSCYIHTIPYPIFKTFLNSFDFDNEILDEGDETTPSSYMNDTSGGLGEGKMVYLVMDSDKFDPALDCVELNPVGQINCDFNDDGIMDVEGGANRGWLLLDGTGASDLTNIMLEGYPAPITLPHWFPGKSGVSNSVFINAHTIRFNVVLIPVFNAMCDNTTKDDIPTLCPSEYQAGDLISGSSGLGTYYRVAGFAPFVVTCVSKGTSEKCPAKTFSNIKANVSTIEGYFVSGYSTGLEIDPNGFDLGVYMISLTR